MTERAFAAVVTATRWWLRAYTAGLDPTIADARRCEIECDLWQMQHDPDPHLARRRITIAVGRLLPGMIDDLAWRLDHAPAREQLFTRRVIAVAVATLMVASLWGLSATIFSGRRQLVSCAESAPVTTSRAAFRHDVIRCAGAFFNAAR